MRDGQRMCLHLMRKAKQPFALPTETAPFAKATKTRIAHRYTTSRKTESYKASLAH